MKLNKSAIKAQIEDSYELIQDFLHDHVKLFSRMGTMDKITLTYRGKMALIIELSKNGNSIRTIAEQLNMSVGSVHRYIKMNENK